MQSFDLIRPEGRVKIQIEVFEEDGETICGIYQLTGTIRARPKAWLSAVRFELRKLERMARASGCAEMRVAGRNWSRILTDYAPFTGPENGLRKRLL